MSDPSLVSASTPWSAAQPYLLDVMGQGKSLYNSTAPNFTNPASNFSYPLLTGSLGNFIGGTTPLGTLTSGLTPQLGSAFATQLSGTPDYSAVNGALGAANQQVFNQFTNSFIPQMNAKASYLNNPTGAIKDTNWALSQLGQNMDLNAQQAYLGQYDNALARQAGALSLGGGLLQGAGQQSLQGASLFPSISQLPFSNLANYANIIGNTGGKFGTQSQTQNPGSFGTAANILGGLTAGAGLYNQLFPNSGGGIGGTIAGGLKSLFGGSSGNSGLGQTALDNYNLFNNVQLSDPTSGFGNNLNDVTSTMPDFFGDGSTVQPDYYSTGDPSNYFTSAGGQAANSMTSTAPTSSTSSNLGTMAGIGAGALGIYGGLSSGKPTGYASAGLQGARLGANNNVFGSNSGAVNTGAGYGMNALGIYNGLKQGGVTGDTSAAVNAAQLGSRLGAFGGASGAIGSAAGYAAAPLAVYNAVNNWQSGNTGSDALNGAEAGAAIGSIIPGVGTLIGGLVGGAVGAASSAFGPGRKDPESQNWGNYTAAISKGGNNPAQAQQVANSMSDPYIALAGLFDLRGGQLHGNIPMYSQYGRMGEAKFTTDMTKQINQALSSGTISQNSTPQEVMQKVVNPWISSFGKGQYTDPSAPAMNALLTRMVGDYMNGSWQQSWRPIGGQAVSSWASGIQPFGSTQSAQPSNQNGFLFGRPMPRLMA